MHGHAVYLTCCVCPSTGTHQGGLPEGSSESVRRRWLKTPWFSYFVDVLFISFSKLSSWPRLDLACSSDNCPLECDKGMQVVFSQDWPESVWSLLRHCFDLQPFIIKWNIWPWIHYIHEYKHDHSSAYSSKNPGKQMSPSCWYRKCVG